MSDYGYTYTPTWYEKNEDKLGGIVNSAVSAINKAMNPNANDSDFGNVLSGIGNAASIIPGIGGIIGAGVNFLGGLYNAGFGNNINDSYVWSIEDEIASQAGYKSSASDSTGLLNEWGNLKNLGKVTSNNKDSQFNIGFDGWFNNKAGNIAKRLNSESVKANRRAWNSIQNTKSNINRNTMMDLGSNYIANGGNLNRDTNFNNGITFINNGGKHESNLYKGVPFGKDYLGNSNLVEEGEVIFGDYVFSNRLRVPKSFKKKYKVKGDTFADIAKELQKESSERPNDSISKNGLNKYMSDLIVVSENVRRNKDNKSRVFAEGGPFSEMSPEELDAYITNALRASSANNKPSSYSSNKASEPIIIKETKVNNDGDKLYGTPLLRSVSENLLKNSPTSIIAKALNGELVDPVEVEDIPFIEYDDDFVKLKKDTVPFLEVKKANPVNYTENQNNEQVVDKAIEKSKSGESIAATKSDDKIKDTTDSNEVDKKDEVSKKENLPDLTGIDEDYSGYFGDSALRYAPIVAGGISVLNDILGGNEPNYSNVNRYASAIRRSYNPIGYRPVRTYLKYNPYDLEYYVNQLGQSTAAGRSLIKDNSGGNRATATAGILASDLLYGRNLGDLTKSAYEENYNQQRSNAAFHTDLDKYNSQAGMQANMYNSKILQNQADMFKNLAIMRDNIRMSKEAEHSSNLTNFIEGLSDLGTEIGDRKTLEWLVNNKVLRVPSANGGKIKRRRGYTI